jgi:hypothetical protein
MDLMTRALGSLLYVINLFFGYMIMLGTAWGGDETVGPVRVRVRSTQSVCVLVGVYSADDLQLGLHLQHFGGFGDWPLCVQLGAGAQRIGCG